MYFPYLRGRQYELLALRELANDGLISKKIIPIIEPVKSTSTFTSLVEIYKNKQLPLAFVINPQVGEVKDTAIETLAPYLGDEFIPAMIMRSDVDSVIGRAGDAGIDVDKMIVILNNYDSAIMYSKVYNDKVPLYTLFPDERDIRRAVRHNKVLFEDKFNRREKNVEYLDMVDEAFTNDHLYFEEEGYCGFGDYSIVGDYFSEGGQAPYAVVIHLVYFNERKELRIHHFISDSNKGPENVAGKYGEAVRKIKEWYDKGELKQETKALSVFLQHAEAGYYPGLPTIKKLSIMHHIELMNMYLDGDI